MPGIYVAGIFEEPKDIPETMVQASAAACMAGDDLGPAAKIEHERETLPPETAMFGEEPRVGVFICDCGENIGGVIDVAGLADHARTLPHVAVAELKGHGCSRESMEQIQETIKDEQLNRVVIGGCSPRTHETKFQEVIRQAGLNKYLVEIANIRDQATWVHANRPQRRPRRPRSDQDGGRQRGPLAAADRSESADEQECPGRRRRCDRHDRGPAARRSGFQGLPGGKIAQLGGLATGLRTLEGDDVQAFVKDLINRTEAHENIQVFTRAIIVDHTGMPGMFKTGMQIGPQMFYRQIKHGVTILATGALPNRPDLYLLDESGR